jgi:tetratricopeptide (TPR) repeat protein
VLAIVLLVGLALRVYPLIGRPAGPLLTGGDALEYRQMAEFFMQSDQVAPGNRFPGFPFLLVGLFAILPGSHDAVQVGATVTMGVLAVALVYLLGRRWLGSPAALAAAAIVAVHPHLTANASRGLSEEPFLVCFLGLLWLYVDMRGREDNGIWAYVAVTALAGYTSLVRPDSAYIAVPLAASLGWAEHRRGRRWLQVAARVIPMVALALLLPKLSQVWMVGLGVQELDQRAGRAGLWMEFMLGRMPYEYCFYKETTVREWLLGQHTLTALLLIGAKSVARNALALVDAVGGGLAFLVTLVGVRVYWRRGRDIALALVVPACMVLQFALVSLWPEEDVVRYNIRVLPLMAIFLVMGARWVVSWLPRKVPLAVVLAAVLAPALSPYSLYVAVRPAVDVLYQEREQYLPRVKQVHSRLAAVWQAFSRRELTPAEAESRVQAILQAHDHYAPTHFVLGLLAYTQGRDSEAVQRLARARQIVPYFAEAAVWQADVLAANGRLDEALDVVREARRYRADYPLLALLQGDLLLRRADLPAAATAYREYLSLNRYQHARAFHRDDRVLRRANPGAELPDPGKTARLLASDEVTVTTPYVWDYLSLDLAGITLPMPQDAVVYYNLGVAYARLGEVAEARRHWRTMAQRIPGHELSWLNLGRLEACTEGPAAAGQVLQAAQRALPGSTAIAAAARQPECGAPDGNYGPPDLLLPVTQRPL